MKMEIKLKTIAGEYPKSRTLIYEQTINNKFEWMCMLFFEKSHHTFKMQKYAAKNVFFLNIYILKCLNS